ncbi:regulatory protein, luxR family [Lentzea albidocapillata subsp. violacea]|uniref:Regulatory protein, luxR family n=1 Tax=Lentzea albidocapillata subsp. violacea TaxID=128104 RepID=A0A1G8Q675_9PSEU|nr:LuxR family transcriptional regulator [Lentzea albidocapillata]SDJ00262.1 regulatory protein, luxR family [Lentzea albidocapillata subsp. violacea]
MDALTSASLLGRDDEIRCLDGMLTAARDGRGGALVLRGEAGMGKSALLGHVRESAAGFRVLEASGSEFETELPFAALHQLCVPLMDSLSGPHREALEVAFGLASGKPDVLRIGMATLELLGGGGPVLCLLDDAHWLDEASAQVFAFLGRRLASEPAVLVFAARRPWARSRLDELPGLELRGLDDAEARALLASGPAAVVDDKVRERLLAEARGNPLALLELPKAGGFALPDVASVPNRIERSFQERAGRLPADARLLLTVAGAEPTGEPQLLWAAAAELGIDVASAWVEAEASGLVSISARVRFCHPLARSAVYLAASPAQRQAVHLALASATDPLTDPDRRVWHRAQAGTGPDDSLAAELERSADRARSRGGVAAAAAFLERAAALSLSAGPRAARTLAAAQAKLDAGAVDVAAELLTTFPADDPRADLLRGRIAFVRNKTNDGPSFVLSAARRMTGAAARDGVLDALEIALAFGRPSGVLDAVVREARGLDRGSDALEALVLLADEGHEAAVPLLQRVFSGDDQVWTRHPALATMLAGELWDTEVHSSVTGWLMKTGQQAGSPFVLRLGLAQRAVGAVITGEFGKAVSAIAEEEAIADALGMPPLRYSRLHLAAFRGQEQEVLAETEHSLREASRRAGCLIANTHWASAVLHNGLGDYPVALAAAREAVAPGDLYLAGMALPELIEAAVRCGETAVAAEALEDLVSRTSPCETSWAAGVAAYSHALVTGEEESFVTALRQLGSSTARPHLARAHLVYGEWLRRAGRRVDARTQLRTAHDLLSSIGMEAFAARAALELQATGEVARSRSAQATDELTMQETHIARLVATGATSKEVAARLFLSPRTVDAHLRNIFRKVGINSRRQLRDVFSSA